jgi:hypothetical protein
MKKIKLVNKLSLNKEAITKLNDNQLGQALGGAKPSDVGYSNCGPCYSITMCKGQCATYDPTGCTGAISGCTVCTH